MTLVDTTLVQGLDVRAVGSVVLAIASPFFFSWLLTSWQSRRTLALAARAAPGEKRPPTLPTAVPLVGHIAQFMKDGHGFLSSAVKHFGQGVPVRVNLAMFSSYIVSGPEAVGAFLKDPTRNLSQTARSLNIMEHAFGCPPHLVQEFRARPDTDLEHQIHTALQSMLSGSRLEILAGRYQEAVVNQVMEGDGKMGDDWVELPDLCTFVEKHIFEAATRAVFGPNLIAQAPNLSEDFWNFNRHVKSMFMGVPKWMNKTAVRARDKMTGSVKRWQRYAAEHVDIKSIPEDVEWEPYYGSKSTRIRQQLLTRRGIMDESARAAENLAFMWATNANSVPAAVWFLLETLHDPALEKRVRARLQAASVPPAEKGSQGHLAFDITKLTEDALLQSVYAETLRLRVAVLIVRQPTRSDFSFRGWHIKQNEIVSLSTRTELMDQDFWNAGSASDPHPLDRFWADRFLIKPDDPHSGPLREPKRRAAGKAVGSEEGARFSLDGCTWSWVPFGGGRNLCPGRHFAKREIMLTAAIMLTAYDIELLTDKMPGPDESVFGFGTMPPNAKVPCRIRRRQQG